MELLKVLVFGKQVRVAKMNNIEALDILIGIFGNDYFMGGSFMFLGVMLFLLSRKTRGREDD